MSKKITVREWIEKFNNGDFEDESFKTQVSAGWYDWFCPNQSLTKRLKKMGNIIKIHLYIECDYNLYIS